MYIADIKSSKTTFLSYLHAIAFSVFLLANTSQQRPNTIMKGVFCCSLNCTHMQTKRLIIGSTLTVRNNSLLPSNSSWTSETPKWGLLPWQHPWFVCSPLHAGQHSPGSQSSSNQEWEKRLQYSTCGFISHCLMAAFWCNTIKPRQMLKKQTLFFKSSKLRILLRTLCSSSFFVVYTS